MSEDRYEAIELIVKCRADGESWFDVIHDYITQDCQGTIEEGGCTCGMESMGGSSGTLQQCYDWTENVGRGLKLVDIARALVALADDLGVTNDNVNSVAKAVVWAREEIRFEEEEYDNTGDS